jgi:hypothetical protein
MVRSNTPQPPAAKRRQKVAAGAIHSLVWKEDKTLIENPGESNIQASLEFESCCEAIASQVFGES